MTTFEAIFLPGPVTAAHTIRISSETHHHGRHVRKEVSVRGDGRGVAQATEILNANYSGWYKFLGCEVRVDWCGKGESRYVLEESWGVFHLEVSS